MKPVHYTSSTNRDKCTQQTATQGIDAFTKSAATLSRHHALWRTLKMLGGNETHPSRAIWLK